jgi:hypothetical protein
VNRSKAIVTTQELLILQRCGQFDQLESHATSLLKTFYLKPDVMKERLDGLVQRGFLLSEADLTRYLLERSASSISVPEISSLGVPTRNRPDKLNSGLRSFVQQSRELGRNLRFIIADGSDSEETRQENLAVLSSLKKEFGADFEYIGAAEKEQLVSLLAREADVSLEVVRFAFQNDEGCSVDIGCNRNTLLMATVDELTVQVDDDVECIVSEGLSRELGLKLTSVGVTHDNWFPDSNSIETDPRVDHSTDFFSLHERMLGKTLSNCISELSDGHLNIDQVGASFLRRAELGGVTSVSSLGVHGDSGMGSSYPLLIASGPSYERLVECKEKYDFAMSSHHVRRAVRCYTITETSPSAGYNLGLDNRQIIPPFAPVQRGEDVVFGSLLCLGSEGYFGYLPWTVTHVRPERWKQNMHKSATTLPFGHFIKAQLEARKVLEGAGAARSYSSMGRQLIELGRLSLADFEAVSRRLIWSTALHRIAQIERAMQKNGSDCDYWFRDISSFLQDTRDSMSRDDYFFAADLCAEFGEANGRHLTQRLTRRFGELLNVWTELRKAAARLKARGIRFGRQV